MTKPQVSDSITQFVAAAEAHEKDVLPESVSVASVAEVSRDAFVAAVCNAMPVRPGGQGLHYRISTITSANAGNR